MTRINRRSFLKGAGAAAAGAFAGPAWRRVALAATAETIKLGFPIPLTGPFGPEAKQQEAGATLAVEEINAKGGTLGRKVELIVRDDQLKPGEGAKRAKELIENEKVQFMVGALSAAVQMAVNEQTKKVKMIYVSISQSNEITARPDWSPYTFAEAMNPYITSQAVGRWAVEKLGKRWFFMSADYAFGNQLLDGFSRVVKAQGGTVLGNLHNPLGATDYSAYLPRVRDAKPDVLCLNNFGKDQMNSVKQIHSFGLKAQMKIVCPVLLVTARKEGGAEAFAGVHGGTSFYWELADTIPSAKRFVDAFSKRWGWPPTDYAGYAYSGTRLLLEGVERAKSMEADKVITALEGHTYDHYKGKQWIRACDHRAFQDVYVLRSRDAGQVKGEWGLFDIVGKVSASEDLERSCKELGHA
jgi:branched-chain amino acid transport system substrate-binding protein